MPLCAPASCRTLPTWSSASASARSWSPTISRRRSACPTWSTCSRKVRAPALPKATPCRFRGRAIRCAPAPIRPLRRCTTGCGPTSRARSASSSRRRPRNEDSLRRHSGARAKRGSPESIFTVRGYGFRARHCAAPRNDARLGAAMNPRYAWLRQLVAFAVLLAIWEAAGYAGLLNPLFAPSPSRIGAALVELFSDGRIWPHLEATFTAALGGLVLGIAVGIVLGVIAALIPAVAELLEPVMTML